jgi:hypothetical protein
VTEKREEGRGKREEGRGKREEGRGKREERVISITNYQLPVKNYALFSYKSG